MIELKKELNKMGETFTQIYKDNRIVVYKTTFPSVEVFKYKIHKPDKYHDDVYEVYPCDNNFGLWAWCATSKSQFERILENHFADHPLKCQIYDGKCPILNDNLFLV